MNPNIWGESAWLFLHTITLNYPENPTFLDKHNYTVVKPEPSVVYNETAVRFINGN